LYVDNQTLNQSNSENNNSKLIQFKIDSDFITKKSLLDICKKFLAKDMNLVSKKKMSI